MKISHRHSSYKYRCAWFSWDPILKVVYLLILILNLPWKFATERQPSPLPQILPECDMSFIILDMWNFSWTKAKWHFPDNWEEKNTMALLSGGRQRKFQVLSVLTERKKHPRACNMYQVSLGRRVREEATTRTWRLGTTTAKVLYKKWLCGRVRLSSDDGGVVTGVRVSGYSLLVRCQQCNLRAEN